VQGSTVHGRSCYLGEDREGVHYFAKGIGWIHFSGWDPSHGSFGVLPRWAAERERDFAQRLSSMGIPTVRPQAIIAHAQIPDSGGGFLRRADEVLDLDKRPAFPCMYVYSASSRWRVADLPYLSEDERAHLWGSDKERCDWLRQLLGKLGQYSHLLHEAGGHDYALSGHNVFCDGTRVDFEYACLPGLPHRDGRLNENAETWRGRELDGLRTLAWEVAELLRLAVSVQEVSQWWQCAYGDARCNAP
jgi:hypothetical protein